MARNSGTSTAPRSAAALMMPAISVRVPAAFSSTSPPRSYVPVMKCAIEPGMGEKLCDSWMNEPTMMRMNTPFLI